MATRIKSYISTSVDITQASAQDVSKAVALQALNQIFSPYVYTLSDARLSRLLC